MLIDLAPRLSRLLPLFLPGASGLLAALLFGSVEIVLQRGHTDLESGLPEDGHDALQSVSPFLHPPDRRCEQPDRFGLTDLTFGWKRRVLERLHDLFDV